MRAKGKREALPTRAFGPPVPDAARARHALALRALD